MVVERAHPASLFDFGPLAQEYDRWYETPAGQVHDRVQKEDVRRLVQPGHAGEWLLDVGCGTGHWSPFFAVMGYRVTGIDVSPEMIAIARAAVPQCAFEVADACDLPLGDASFDVAAAMATLEFIPDPAAAVREMVRCAKPGGTLLIGTLNRLAPVNRRRLSKGRQPYASAHLFSPDELRNFLAPWGRVRMVASSPGPRKGRPFLSKRIATRLPVFRGRLDGPFIVAEVGL
jgi:SAM-dependent methyltransferase